MVLRVIFLLIKLEWLNPLFAIYTFKKIFYDVSVTAYRIFQVFARLFYRLPIWTARWMTSEANCKFIGSNYLKITFRTRKITGSSFVFLALSRLWKKFPNTRINSRNYKRKRPNSISEINWRSSKRKSSHSRKKIKRSTTYHHTRTTK